MNRDGEKDVYRSWQVLQGSQQVALTAQLKAARSADDFGARKGLEGQKGHSKEGHCKPFTW